MANSNRLSQAKTGKVLLDYDIRKVGEAARVAVVVTDPLDRIPALNIQKKWQAVTASGLTTAIDLANGLSAVVTMGSNTTFSFTNKPAASASSLTEVELIIIQGASDYTIAFADTVKWSSGTAPATPSGAGTVLVVRMSTKDGGTTWYADAVATGEATAASNVTFTPYGTIAATNAQAAIQELEDDKSLKLSKTGDTLTDGILGALAASLVGMHGVQVAQRAGAIQAALIDSTTGAASGTYTLVPNTLPADTDNNMATIVVLLNEIRDALVAKGIIKGSI